MALLTTIKLPDASTRIGDFMTCGLSFADGEVDASDVQNLKIVDAGTEAQEERIQVGRYTTYPSGDVKWVEAVFEWPDSANEVGVKVISDTQPNFILHPSLTGRLDTLVRPYLLAEGLKVDLLGTGASWVEVHDGPVFQEHLLTIVFWGWVVKVVRRSYTNSTTVDYWRLVKFGTTADNRVNVSPVGGCVHCRFAYTFDGGSTYREFAFDQADDWDALIGHGQGLPIRYLALDLSGPEHTVRVDTERMAAPGPVMDWYPDGSGNTLLAPFYRAPKRPSWMTEAEAITEAQEDATDLQEKVDSLVPFQGNLTDAVYVRAGSNGTGPHNHLGICMMLPELHSGYGYRLPALRKYLYQSTCQPGKFDKADGTVLKESDRPGLFLDSYGWFNPSAPDKGWINHTKSPPYNDDMARDPNTGEEWTFMNHEHWGVIQLTQADQVYADPGFRMLLDYLEQAFLMGVPGEPKGTTHHNPGSGRMQGRTSMSGMALGYNLQGCADRAIKRGVDFVNLHGSNPTLSHNPARWFPWQECVKILGMYAIYQEDTSIGSAMVGLGQWVLDKLLLNDGTWLLPYEVHPVNGPAGYSTTYIDEGIVPGAMTALKIVGYGSLSGAEQTKLDDFLTDALDISEPAGSGWQRKQQYLLLSAGDLGL